MQYNTTTAYAGMTIVPLAANGKIDIFAGATTDVIADVTGYFTTSTSGQKYHAIGAVRMIDTRQDGGTLQTGGTMKVTQGNTVIALNPTLILNLTVTQPGGPGNLIVYPDGSARPTTSNINFIKDETVAALALASANAGTIDIYDDGPTTQVIVDCLGYFATN